MRNKKTYVDYDYHIKHTQSLLRKSDKIIWNLRKQRDGLERENTDLRIQRDIANSHLLLGMDNLKRLLSDLEFIKNQEPV